MKVEKFFSQADRDAVAAAVKEAEKHTSGEIVPYVVSAADAYEVAAWRGAVFGALLGALAAAFLHELAGLWGGWFSAWVVLPPLAGATLGYLVVAVCPWLRRLVIGREIASLRVERRAHEAFLHEEVFKTRDRSGILVFLALFERRVVVLGDSGINAKVAQSEWQRIVDGIVAGIRRGEPGAALAEGIRRCGTLLEERGVAIRPDDTDELSDELRMSDS
jgi:putative membrane protein